MAEKENRRKVMTRQLLQLGLIECLQNKPLQKVTVKEICERADVNRSTFYLYYTDPSALLREMEADLLQQASIHLDQMDSGESTRGYMKELLLFIKGKKELFVILLDTRDDPSFTSSFMEASLQNLKKTLIIRGKEEVQDYVYAFLLRGCLAMIRLWLDRNCDLPADLLADRMFLLANQAVKGFEREK